MTMAISASADALKEEIAAISDLLVS